MINAYLTGNLGNDAEEKQVNGKTVIEFSVASNDRRTDTVTWVRVNYWRDSPKLLDYLTKGKLVGVRGEIVINDTGEKTFVNMRADEIELLGGGGSADRDDRGGRDQGRQGGRDQGGGGQRDQSRRDERGGGQQRQQGGGRDQGRDQQRGRDDQRGGRDDRGGGGRGGGGRDTGSPRGGGRQPDPDDDIPFDLAR